MTRRRCSVLISDTVSPANPAGISRYFQEVLNALTAEFGSDVTLCSARSPEHGPARLIRMPWFRGSERLHVHDVIASSACLLFRPSVFYSPSYARALTTAPQVFTVHDMTHELFPDQVLQRPSSLDWFVARKRRCLEQAAVILAISHYTAQTVMDRYPHLDKSKFLVTPLGVDESFFAARGHAPDSGSKPFFLYVGQRTPYKNFDRLLMAFAQSGLSNDFDLRVISPIGAGFNSGEIQRIRDLELQHAVHLSTAVSDSELIRSYAVSTALVYPSQQEGFGLPILEAMASGTIVATSNTSSMPEVGGDVAFYFDPFATEQISESLNKVVRLSAVERKTRIENGIARARTFPWSRCQHQTVEAIKALIP